MTDASRHFLKSLTREEGQSIASSGEFWDAAEIVQILNSTAFAEKAVTADVGLFMSRVNANIVSRLKKARGTSHHRQSHKDSAEQAPQKDSRKTSLKSTDESQTTENEL